MNKNLMEIIFLIDRSGSMSGLESDTIGGFNAFIANQQKLEGDTRVTAVLFDDKYEVLWNGVDANKVKLTEKEYYVRGSTALLDAIGKTIYEVGYRLAYTNEAEIPGKVIFVITTDGMENSSREFTSKKIREMIMNHKEKYNWEFIFLGANIDAEEEADNIGISREDAYNFEASKVGVESMFEMMCEAVCEKREIYNKK